LLSLQNRLVLPWHRTSLWWKVVPEISSSLSTFLEAKRQSTRWYKIASRRSYDEADWAYDSNTNCYFAIPSAIFWHAKDFSTAHDVADDALQTNAPITLRPRIPRIAKNWQISGFVRIRNTQFVKFLPVSYIFVVSSDQSGIRGKSFELFKVLATNSRFQTIVTVVNS